MNINTKTKICCVIGNPITHSLSPSIHNAGYKFLGLNFIYTAFKIENLKDAVKGFKALDIKGISITLPHKVNIIPFLDAIDKKAKEIGAVNTVVNNNGILKGFNTDCDGALKALKEVTDLKNKKIIIVGAGGAAKAIAFGLKEENTNILILNRTLEKARYLAQEINAKFGSLDNLSEIKNCDILIHTTSSGMHPNTNQSIIPQEFLHKNLVVFDVVYNPKETLLIKNAKQKRCKIVHGYKMLLYQAATQFEMFTNQKAPIGVMEKTLLEELNRKEKNHD